MTRHVAAQVEALRKQRGWSVQHLADRCADAGQPSLKRSVLVNLERGRRRYLTIGELHALGDVFDVTPAALLPPGERSKFCGQFAVDQQVELVGLVVRELRHVLHRVVEVVGEARAGTVDEVRLARIDAHTETVDQLIGQLDDSRQHSPHVRVVGSTVLTEEPR